MALSEQDQGTYLSNVICLARVDGTLSPKELAAFEEIRADIGAKKSVLNTATKAVDSASFSPAKVGTFADQVKNLADMLYVCFVDGELEERERAVISDFCASIGLTKAQFEFMAEEAISRVNRTALSLKCPSCGTTVNSTVKFCSNCGQAIVKAEEEAVKVNFEIPPNGYSIEFCESTSAGFQAALEFAKSAPSFETCLRGRKKWYLASWAEQSLLDVLRLAELLTGIRNRNCYRNGSEMPWDELFGFSWCARTREAAYRPVEYCFGKDEKRVNPWGCKQARMEWAEWAPWLSFGQFKRTGVLKTNYVWIFDKARIRHEIMTDLHRFRFCPYLRPRLVDAVLRALPDEVEVTPKGPWKYSRAYEEKPGCIKMVEVNKSEGYEFKEEYFADGVRPIGIGILEEILRKAFAETGVSDITAAQITK